MNEDGEKYKLQFDITSDNHCWIMALSYIEEEKTVLDGGCGCGDFG